ncbi:zinc-ribbon domain-containing protein [Nodularia spumigena]
MDLSRVPVPVTPDSTSQSIGKTNPQPSNSVHNRIACSNCGNNNSTNSKFCIKCGKPLIKHP